MMFKTIRFIGAGLMAAALSACGGNNDYKPSTGMPVEQLFAEACAGCHGDKGEGKFGFLLAIAGSDKADEELVTSIREGGVIMPAFSQISEDEAAAIVGYLKNR
jgi:mono/diheme cytochrome c family protein